MENAERTDKCDDMDYLMCAKAESFRVRVLGYFQAYGLYGSAIADITNVGQEGHTKM